MKEKCVFNTQCGKMNNLLSPIRQINSLVFSLVKALLSRNCQKSVTVNFRNFHTVILLERKLSNFLREIEFSFRRLKLSILYPATTGRNFDEILRVIDSLQLTAEKKVATPADWQSGGSCMVVPSVKPDEVAGLFPKGVTIHDVPR